MSDRAARRLRRLLRGRPHLPAHIAPIVANARFMVRCDCGYAHDSGATTHDAAIDDISVRHPAHDGCALAAAQVDYTGHPIYRGVYEHEDVKVQHEWKRRSA